MPGDDGIEHSQGAPPLQQDSGLRARPFYPSAMAKSVAPSVTVWINVENLGGADFRASGKKTGSLPKQAG